MFVDAGRFAVYVGPQSLPEAMMNEPGWLASHRVTSTTRRCSTVVPLSLTPTTQTTVPGGRAGALEVSVVGSDNVVAAAGGATCACCDAGAAHLPPAPI